MKVLIVADDPVFARLATRKLESWGHRPSVALTGTEAYELIRQQPFRFVLCGSNVPGLPGPELCRKIRQLKRARYTYVVIYENHDKLVMPAGAERLGLMAALQAGADDYLTSCRLTRSSFGSGSRTPNACSISRTSCAKGRAWTR